MNVLAVMLLFSALAWNTQPAPVEALIEMAPEELDGYYTDDPLIEYDENDPSYVMSVTQIYYDIDGNSIRLEWNNRNVNPYHFEQEVDRLPEQQYPGFIPEEFPEYPFNVSREDNQTLLAFYLEEELTVFTVTVTSAEEELRREMIGMVLSEFDFQQLRTWEGFTPGS